MFQETLTSRAQWIEARKKGLGASDAAAILGVSPWKGALQLYHEKLGIVDTPKGESFARELGLALERPIAELYAKRTERKIILPKPGTFVLERHPVRPYMVATLDGLQTFTDREEDRELRLTTGVLEIKTASIAKIASWQNEAPIDYQVQVQHQLAVTGNRFGTCVALVGGVTLVYSDIKRDPEFIEMLENACAEFWRRLQLKDPPPPDGTEATKAFLKMLYPKEEPKAATLPPDAITWDQERVAADRAIKDWTGKKLEAEAKLKLAIGEATMGILPNGVVYTWRTQNRKGYTVAPTSFRDFRRKGTKDEKPPTLRKGQAPSIDDVTNVFEQQRQNEEQESVDAGDITFD